MRQAGTFSHPLNDGNLHETVSHALTAAHDGYDSVRSRYIHNLPVNVMVDSGRHRLDQSGMDGSSNINFISKAFFTQPNVIINSTIRSGGNKSWQGFRFSDGVYILDDRHSSSRNTDTFVNCVFEDGFRIIVRSGHVVFRNNTFTSDNGGDHEYDYDRDDCKRDRDDWRRDDVRRDDGRRDDGRRDDGRVDDSRRDRDDWKRDDARRDDWKRDDSRRATAVINFLGDSTGEFIGNIFNVTENDSRWSSIIYLGSTSGRTSSITRPFLFQGNRWNITTNGGGSGGGDGNRIIIIEIDTTRSIFFVSNFVLFDTQHVSVAFFGSWANTHTVSLFVSDSNFINVNASEIFISLISNLWAVQSDRSIGTTTSASPTIYITRSTLQWVRAYYYNQGKCFSCYTLGNSYSSSNACTRCQSCTNWQQNITITNTDITINTINNTAMVSAIDIESLPSSLWMILLSNVTITTNNNNVPIYINNVASVTLSLNGVFFYNTSGTTTQPPVMVLNNITGTTNVFTTPSVSMTGFSAISSTGATINRLTSSPIM